MLSMSLFAQMNAFKPDGPQVGGFGVVTLAFLFLVWLFDKRSRQPGANIVLLGVLVVVLSCCYAFIGDPTLATLTPELSKVGFVLVLGGLAWSLIASCPNRSAIKEGDHA
jgi:hypothetical protein